MSDYFPFDETNGEGSLITSKHINIKFLLYNNYTNSYTSVLLETVFQNLD